LPNPWRSETKNLKAQSLLEQRDPALAAHFKAMADDAYGTIAKLMDAEAARRVVGSIPYTEKEHALNVFRGENQTARAEFTKRDPELAKFYEREARDVEIPIFGKNRNMTIEGRLVKDPSTAATVQVARRIHEQWNAEDVATAKQQRSEAEAALKRLESQAA
jgi:hypothetical protein